MGNGVNIQFGGKAYSNRFILSRIIFNAQCDKYDSLFEGTLSGSEIEQIFRGLFPTANAALDGKYDKVNADDEVKRAVMEFKAQNAERSKFEHYYEIPLEDWFLLLRLFFMDNPDLSDMWKASKQGFEWMILDAIYNAGKIQEIYQKMKKPVKRFFKSFDSIFTLNYDNNTDKFNLSQSFTFNIMKGLTFKTTGTWFYFDDSREFFKGDYIVATGPVYDTNHSTSNKHERLLDQTYNGILNYQTTFRQDHSMDAMVGVEYYDSYKKGFSASGYGSPLSDFQDLNYTSTAAGVRQIDSWHYRQRILSFFGRVNYDYKSKYLLSLVLRRDGYSKLPKDNRWGTFPGISAGWVLSRENFMESCSNVLSYAKIRASYGANGNVSGVLDANGNVVTGLDYYTVQGSYGIMKDKDGKIVPNYNGKVPLMINDLPNPTMRWEKSYTFETGFDIGFLNNKYILNFTYYNRHTQDKFAEITLPSHSGVSSFLSNNGEVQNQGMELELTANVLRTKDWKFTVSMNTAYNKNKIISLPYNGLPNNMQDAYQVYTGRKLADGTYERQWVGGYQEGQEYGVIYAFKSLGIYKSESEIPGNLIDRSTYTENGADAKVLYGPEAWAKLSDAEKEKGLPIQAGDVKWQDVNGDGVIDDYDRVKLGNTIPHWTGGFNINTSWKGLTLNCRLDYALGYWVHDWKTPWIMGNMQGTFNTISLVKDSWSESNPNGKYPVYGWADFLGKRNYDRISDINCYRGDYLAFREISLSYSLPQSWIHKSGLSKVDVSVTAQNLGYITAAKNMATPEYGVSQNGGYPLPRTVVLGLNVTF